MLRIPFVIGLAAGFILVFAGPVSAEELSSSPPQITSNPNVNRGTKSDIVLAVFETTAEMAPVAQISELLKVHKISVNRAWGSLSVQQRAMVDLMAADFFNSELSGEQRRRIVAQTARSYAAAGTLQKQAMRRARRATYGALSEAQRQRLFNNPKPSYLHLNEAQKAPFRRHAMEVLGLKFNASAIAKHLRESI